MSTDAQQAAAPQARPARFDREAFRAFRFTARELDPSGAVTLGYALDEELSFVERFELPVEHELSPAELERAEGLLALLHWVAGVSYFKTALPAQVSLETGSPPPATAALLEALYSEGLGELAYTNQLPVLPRPRFSPAQPGVDAPALGEAPGQEAPVRAGDEHPPDPLGRVLVPIGGGKDSVVALELVRAVARETALFSIGDAPPIMRTAAVAALPHLIARRTLDPGLAELNRRGALNGHVPVTAIVTCAAVLTASLRGFDTVAMANERSASVGNLHWAGVEVNHQFSKGLRAERLLSGALAELAPGVGAFSVLRPSSELAIARAFAGMERYHPAFTSCNAIFRIDPALRSASWCCECPKCRFVFLALAPFTTPAHLREVFGRDLLAEEGQFDGFALLTATGGHKPFECVGEEQESLAAIRLLAGDPRWSAHAVLKRLAAEVLPLHPPPAGDPAVALALSEQHAVPAALMAQVRALLGA